MTNSPIEKYLEYIYEKYNDNVSGEVADYIPELENVDPNKFGIVLATADGQIYRYGDTSDHFTIQSISKPFTYALAIADNGLDYVDRKIDVEPSGEAFNEISLDADSHRPKNGMINAGAITSTSLVKARSAEERYERIRTFYSDFAGRELSPDYGVFQSELNTGHRNRAIAWMLKNFDIIEGDPEEVIKAYFEQCSTMVTVEDLAIMGATLANNGTNPVTGKQLIDAATVERVLSVMMTAGMYDGAGDWMTSVGLPAKSGVGGGIVGVLPGQLAVAVFSPRLDSHGNSVRGVKAFEDISRDLHLHIMNVARESSSAIKAIYTIDERPSILRRTKEEEEILQDYGNRAKIIEAQGDILFSGAEKIIRESLQGSENVDILIYDNTFVESVTAENNDDIVKSMLYDVGRERIAEGKSIAIIDPRVKYENEEDIPVGLKIFKSTETALQWAEEKIIEEYSPLSAVENVVQCPIDEFDFFSKFPQQEKEEFIDLLQPRTFSAGERVLLTGAENQGLYFIVKGKITASLQDGENSSNYRRVSVLIPGMSLGQQALTSGNGAEFDVYCQTNAELLFLSTDEIKKMSQENPALLGYMWQAIALDAYDLFDRTLRQLSSRVEQDQSN